MPASIVNNVIQISGNENPNILNGLTGVVTTIRNNKVFYDVGNLGIQILSGAIFTHNAFQYVIVQGNTTVNIGIDILAGGRYAYKSFFEVDGVEVFRSDIGIYFTKNRVGIGNENIGDLVVKGQLDWKGGAISGLGDYFFSTSSVINITEGLSYGESESASQRIRQLSNNADINGHRYFKSIRYDSGPTPSPNIIKGEGQDKGLFQALSTNIAGGSNEPYLAENLEGRGIKDNFYGDTFGGRKTSVKNPIEEGVIEITHNNSLTFNPISDVYQEVRYTILDNNGNTLDKVAFLIPDFESPNRPTEIATFIGHPDEDYTIDLSIFGRIEGSDTSEVIEVTLRTVKGGQSFQGNFGVTNSSWPGTARPTHDYRSKNFNVDDVRVTIFKVYGFRITKDVRPFKGKGDILDIGLALIPDGETVEPNVSLVENYEDIETTDNLLDRSRVWETINESNFLFPGSEEHLIDVDGAILDLKDVSLVLTSSEDVDVFSVNKETRTLTVRVRDGEFNPSNRYRIIKTTGSITLDGVTTTATLNDSNGLRFRVVFDFIATTLGFYLVNNGDGSMSRIEIPYASGDELLLTIPVGATVHLAIKDGRNIAKPITFEVQNTTDTIQVFSQPLAFGLPDIVPSNVPEIVAGISTSYNDENNTFSWVFTDNTVGQIFDAVAPSIVNIIQEREEYLAILLDNDFDNSEQPIEIRRDGAVKFNINLIMLLNDSFDDDYIYNASVFFRFFSNTVNSPRNANGFRVLFLRLNLIPDATDVNSSSQATANKVENSPRITNIENLVEQQLRKVNQLIALGKNLPDDPQKQGRRVVFKDNNFVNTNGFSLSINFLTALGLGEQVNQGFDVVDGNLDLLVRDDVGDKIRLTLHRILDEDKMINGTGSVIIKLSHLQSENLIANISVKLLRYQNVAQEDGTMVLKKTNEIVANNDDVNIVKNEAFTEIKFNYSDTIDAVVNRYEITFDVSSTVNFRIKEVSFSEQTVSNQNELITDQSAKIINRAGGLDKDGNPIPNARKWYTINGAEFGSLMLGLPADTKDGFKATTDNSDVLEKIAEVFKSHKGVFNRLPHRDRVEFLAGFAGSEPSYTKGSSSNLTFNGLADVSILDFNPTSSYLGILGSYLFPNEEIVKSKGRLK